MHNKSAFRFFLLSLLVLAAIVTLFSNKQPVQVKAGDTHFVLKAPAFVGTANASELSSGSSIASVLDEEAGISAYFQTPSPIDLNNVRGLFHTIEIETADYILGSISVPDNWEQYDVHVYIHKSGWVLTYYLRDKPTVRIFDWQTYAGSMNPTRFQAVANEITETLNLSDPTLTYYDFRYPNATNLLLAVEDIPAYTSDSFDILDTSFAYYERSWMLGGKLGDANYDAYVKYELDGTEIHRITGDYKTAYDTGFLSASQLASGDPHTISIYHHSDTDSLIMGALSIVYGP
jgi:hypothetical protein